MIGELSFAAGHLTLVSKEWMPSDSAATVVATVAVIEALQSLEGSSSCSVHSSRQGGSQYELDEVHVVCGAHLVSIAVTTAGARSHASVSEIWRDGSSP